MITREVILEMPADYTHDQVIPELLEKADKYFNGTPYTIDSVNIRLEDKVYAESHIQPATKLVVYAEFSVCEEEK